MTHSFRGVVVFSATFKNISVISVGGGAVLLVEETGENHRLVTCH